MARPLRSTGITRFIATTRQSAPARCFGTFGLAGHPLAPFPLAPPSRFSSSAPEPRPESRLLYPGHHMDGNQVSSMLFPEKMSLPGFDVIRCISRPLPEVHLRSSLWTPHDVIASRLFRNVHHLCHWAEAAYGCLKPAPESRLRRTYLHLWYSMARSKRSAFFLTQDFLHLPARVLVTVADRLTLADAAMSSRN